MAASIATLKVIEEENLLFNAQIMGDALRQGLEALQERFPGIGDVRGMGLMQGMELVRDRKTKEPAVEETKRLMDLARNNGLIIGKGGLYSNVLRISPALTCRRSDVDNAISLLDRSFSQLR